MFILGFRQTFEFESIKIKGICPIEELSYSNININK